MLGSVALRTLRDVRRALIWWSLGLAGFVAMVISVFPTIHDNPAMKKLIADYPTAIKGFVSFGGQVDYTTGPGYLGSELFAIWAPMLLLIAAIGAGARAIAGEEERGTLDLLLANPITRTRIVIEKFVALVAEVLALGAVFWCALAVGTSLVSMGVGPGRLAEAVSSACLLAVGFGGLALFVGAGTGRRGVAVAVSAAATVAAYFVNSLAPLVRQLRGIRIVSPFYQYTASDPLRHGLALAHLWPLVAFVILVAVVAPLLFERRDLT